METHPCVSEVAHMQEQHQQPQQQQQQSESVVNIKRVSLPFVSHGLIDTDMSKADDVTHILKQKLHHVETLVDGSTQLVNLSSMDNNCDSVVNIPKELILITLVSQEQALYNPKHALYRSTKSKDEKWAEIGNHVGWTGEWGGLYQLLSIPKYTYVCGIFLPNTDTQCKAKWKAMRDQYCRELKRAKVNTKVKWKYFKELDFLRPYALARK